MKRYISKGVFGLVADMAGAVVLASFLLIAISSFFNLNVSIPKQRWIDAQTAQTRQGSTSDILGASTETAQISIKLRDGDALGIFREPPVLRTTNDGAWEVRGVLKFPRDRMKYASMPLLLLQNTSDIGGKLKISGYFVQRTNTSLSFELGGETYPLQTHRHRTFLYEVRIDPYERSVLNIGFENTEGVSFPEEMVLIIRPVE